MVDGLLGQAGLTMVQQILLNELKNKKERKLVQTLSLEMGEQLVLEVL